MIKVRFVAPIFILPLGFCDLFTIIANKGYLFGKAKKFGTVLQNPAIRGMGLNLGAPPPLLPTHPLLITNSQKSSADVL